MTSIAASQERPVEGTVYPVIFAVGFCHMLNDMMQSLIPSIYPNLKTMFDLNFTQIGLITLVFQVTASLLQPLVGLYGDRRAVPYLLPAGAAFTLTGLLLLGLANSYAMVLIAASVVGMGSSVFHPESSRVVRMAAGARHGFGQATFQVGGNIGGAVGPLIAAFVVLKYGHSAIAWCSLLALLSIAVLWNVGRWYKHHGLERLKARHHASLRMPLPHGRTVLYVGVLLALIFSKFFYLASITSYYTFYLIHHFHLSVRDAQLHLFLFLAAVAVGTFTGGPIGDRYGRKYLIWFSVLGALPFALILPFANLFWTATLTVLIGLILASAFPAIVVYGQELIPGRVGMVSGLFFGFSFGMGGLGAAAIGVLADHTSIEFVYRVCAFLPAIGLLAAFLPSEKRLRALTHS
ncbi:MAG TPA: MFS transporter [Rhizomicrobium sp.]|nr:MFS transporter [Rhizomicrobium sp.]